MTHLHPLKAAERNLSSHADSDKNSDSGSGSGSGSGSDQDESGSDRDSGSDDGSDQGSGSEKGSGSGSGSDSDSDASSSRKGKKAKRKQKGKEHAIDELEETKQESAPKPKLSLFFELQSVLRQILMDLDGVGKQVNQLEMRYNPKPIEKPPPPAPPSPPKRPISQQPRQASPTRNYFPPGYTGNPAAVVNFEDDLAPRQTLR